MVVAQLAEQLLPTPEIRGLNPNISNKVFRMCTNLSITNKMKTKIKKIGQERPIKKELKELWVPI